MCIIISVTFNTVDVKLSDLLSEIMLSEAMNNLDNVQKKELMKQLQRAVNCYRKDCSDLYCQIVSHITCFANIW